MLTPNYIKLLIALKCLLSLILLLNKNCDNSFDLLSKDQVKRLGWLPKDGESNDDQLTRPYILSASLFARNNDSITQAHQIFTENQDKLESLSADIRGLVLKNEVQNFGNAELFDELIKAYQQTADASFKTRLANGNGQIQLIQH